MSDLESEFERWIDPDRLRDQAKRDYLTPPDAANDTQPGEEEGGQKVVRVRRA